MNTDEQMEGGTGRRGEGGVVTSINISPGGIPKRPVEEALVALDGLVGDGRAHAKHIKPFRAVSLLDAEVIATILGEGYAVGAGAMGENLTTTGLDLLSLAPGTRLRFAGGVEIELTEPRAPCFVLDAIHPDLKDAVRGRFGWMARVVTPGVLRVGDSVTVVGAGRRLASPLLALKPWATHRAAPTKGPMLDRDVVPRIVFIDDDL